MKPARTQRGLVTVELSIAIILLMLVLAPLLLFGRALWYYGAIKAAGMHGARMMAAAPYPTYQTPARRATLTATVAAAITQSLVNSGIPASSVASGAFEIRCDNGPCSGSLPPQRVGVVIILAVDSHVLPSLLGSFMPNGIFTMESESQLSYANVRPFNAVGAP
jgi:hypothetical protein